MIKKIAGESFNDVHGRTALKKEHQYLSIPTNGGLLVYGKIVRTKKIKFIYRF